MASRAPGTDLLETARKGEEQAFAALVAPRRPELHAHLYRMLGSVHDADDALQETLVRAWRSLDGLQDRGALRPWLFRIATNVAITAAGRRAAARVLPADEVTAGTGGGQEQREAPLWIEPYPTPDAELERRETLELAFVAVLQHLPPNERATLLAREVLGFSARETADVFGTSPAAVNSALQRARKLLDERAALPHGDPPPRGPELDRLVARYADALERGDVDAVLALLTDDATWSMPPLPAVYRGHDAIARFLREQAFTVEWRHRRTWANGAPAVAGYAWDAERGVYELFALDVLTLRGGRIAAVTAFLGELDVDAFGLPRELPAEAPSAQSTSVNASRSMPGTGDQSRSGARRKPSRS